VHGSDVPGRALERRSHAAIERCERSSSGIAWNFERFESDAVVFASHLEQRAITVAPNAAQDIRGASLDFAVRLLRPLEKRVAIRF
jgi:hypothetical protein